MQISLTGRHVEITTALREHIEKKLDKLHSYGDSIIDVRVVLSVEKYRKFAEITILGRGATKLHSQEATDDMYASVDKAIEKIERQLKRHIAKKRKGKRHKDGPGGATRLSRPDSLLRPGRTPDGNGAHSFAGRDQNDVGLNPVAATEQRQHLEVPIPGTSRQTHRPDVGSQVRQTLVEANRALFHRTGISEQEQQSERQKCHGELQVHALTVFPRFSLAADASRDTMRSPYILG